MGKKGDLIKISSSNTMCYKCSIYTLHTVGRHTVFLLVKQQKKWMPILLWMKRNDRWSSYSGYKPWKFLKWLKQEISS